MKDGKHVILYVDDDQDVLDASAGAGDQRLRHGRGPTAEDGLKVYKESSPTCSSST